MEGIFHKRLNRIYGILGTVSGVGLTGLFGFLLAVDPAIQGEDMGYILLFMVFGVIAAAVSIYSLIVTKRVFLRVTEDRITGFSGLSGQVDCAMDDVAHVSWGGTGLSMELKNGKRLNFNDLANAWEIGSFIRERTFVAPKVDMDREELARTVIALKRKCNRLSIGAAVGALLLIPEILLTALLTGGQELDQFAREDWTILGVGAAAVVVTFAIFFLLMRRWVKAQWELQQYLFAVPAKE